jgi:Arc/MetJ-type ribon-helix-helix transcriptional regulator
MALSVNVTVSMPPEMVEKIDEHRGSMSRSRYIRSVIEECDGTPFETPEESSLPSVDDLAESQTGAV